MGMFDYVRCEYKMPVEIPLDGWQTKDTPRQSLDTYTIREDGTLWVQEYDIEDHSDPSADGIRAFAGCMTRVNHRDVPCDMTGEVIFYKFEDDAKRQGWIEISAQFKDGVLQSARFVEVDQ